MSRALLGLGRKTDAIAELNEALRLDPNSEPARQMLNRISNE